MPSEAAFLPTVAKALAVHNTMRTWVAQFPNVLKQAQEEAEGLPDGMVWQDRLVEFWSRWDKFEVELRALDEVLDALHVGSKLLGSEAEQAREATYDPPLKARIEYGFGDFDFYPLPSGRDHIAYPLTRLKTWAEAFRKWVEASTRVLKDQERLAKRKLKTP